MAGLLGFDPQQFAGLLGDIQRWQRSPEQAQQAMNTPSLLPSEPAFDMGISTYGDMKTPVFGQPPQQPQVSSQSRMPQQAMQPQMPQPQIGMGDRMRAGFEGFVENAHTGPLGAIMGGMMRATGGGNATEQLLMSKGGLDQPTARAVMRNPTLMAAIAPQLFGGRSETDDIKEYKFDQSQPGAKPETFREFMMRKRSTSGEYGLNAVWGVNAKGEPTAYQLGKSGQAIEVKLPGDGKIARDPIKVEGPTGTALLDPQTRQQIGFIPKDIAGAEKAKVEGKGQGDAAESLKSMQSKMPGLEKVVTELDDLSTKATYTAAGKIIDFGMKQAGLEPREAAVARARYTAMIDNQILPLLRDTFGAAFTQKEGDTLRDTLGNADKSPAEKQAVLKAFIQQKRRDIEALQSRFPSQGAPAGAAQSDPLGLRR